MNQYGGRTRPYLGVEERFAFGPLERLLAGPARRRAETIGVSRRTVVRLRQRGMDWVAADRYAIAAGLHPAVVWPEWFGAETGTDRLVALLAARVMSSTKPHDKPRPPVVPLGRLRPPRAALELRDAECAYAECRRLFVPKVASQRYCSIVCGERARRGA